MVSLPIFLFLCCIRSISSPPPLYLHGWVEARVKQGFVFNDVSNSRHDGLVQQNVAQHPASLTPHRLLRAGGAETPGANIQTHHSLHSLLTVLCPSVGTHFHISGRASKKIRLLPRGQLVPSWDNTLPNSFFQVFCSGLFVRRQQRWNFRQQK